MISLALGLVTRRFEVDPADQFAGLDLGIVTVLQNGDALDRRVRKALPHGVLEARLESIKIRAIHVAASSSFVSNSSNPRVTLAGPGPVRMGPESSGPRRLAPARHRLSRTAAGSDRTTARPDAQPPDGYSA